MSQWAAVVAVVGGILGITAGLGGLVVWFKGSYNKARYEALKEDVEAYARREERHEKEMTECQGQVAVLTARVQHLEEENLMLKELSTQRAAVDSLAVEVHALVAAMGEHHAALDKHHTESMAAWKRIGEGLSHA